MLACSPLLARVRSTLKLDIVATTALVLLANVALEVSAMARSASAKPDRSQVCNILPDPCRGEAKCAPDIGQFVCPITLHHEAIGKGGAERADPKSGQQTSSKGDVTPTPTPSPTPTPAPSPPESVLNQTITVTFNTFVSFPDMAKPISHWHGSSVSAAQTDTALAANASYGIGVGVATNGSQTAVSIGAGVTGAAVVSGRLGTRSAALGQGIGIAVALNTPTSSLNAAGNMVVNQFISISVNTSLAIFGVSSPYGVGTLAGLQMAGLKTTDKVSLVTNATLPASGALSALVTAATLSGSTTVAALSTPAGSALATAKSVNAGTAAAMIVSTGTPAIAGSGPMTINQTLSITANTIIGGSYGGGQHEARHTSEPMAQRDDANHHENNDHRVSIDHPQGRLENGDHLLGHDHQPANSEGKDRHHPALAAPDRQQNSVTGLGIEGANGTGPVQATANGAGAGTAMATGPRASSAGAAGQSATVAATNVDDRATPSARVQAVNVTMNAGVATGPSGRQQRANGPAQAFQQANQQAAGSNGAASANASGQASVATPQLASSGAGGAGSTATAQSPALAGAGGVGSASGAAAVQAGATSSPSASVAGAVNNGNTATQASTSGANTAGANTAGANMAGATNAGSGAVSGGQTAAGTQTGSGQTGTHATAGSDGVAATHAEVAKASDAALGSVTP